MSAAMRSRDCEEPLGDIGRIARKYEAATTRAVPYTFRLALLPFASDWRPLLSAPAAGRLPLSKFGPSRCRPLAERVTILTIQD
jgi:hypothetical protein